MSSEKQIEFTKENINLYLKEVAKLYRKQSGKKLPAEMILIGGASVLINYGFREMTTDIDAIIHSSSIMKEIINHVGDEYNLPNGWLNQDFVQTDSYSSKLIIFSKYYATYSNVLTIRTIESEYLIAMKLRSGRQYKQDFSDILGILAEHQKRNDPITIEKIQKAVIELYGDWKYLPEYSQKFIQNVMEDGNFTELYSQVLLAEKKNKELLLDFEHKYPGVTKTDNVTEITNTLQKKTNSASILDMLQNRKK